MSFKVCEQGAGRTVKYPKGKTQCLWEELEGKPFPTYITTVYHFPHTSPLFIISHIHHHCLSRVLEEPKVGKRSHTFSRGTPSHREKAQLGTVLSFSLPSWFLLDVASIRISDGVSIGCYLFFHLDTSPEGTLLCPGLSWLGIPVSRLKGACPVDFCCMFKTLFFKFYLLYMGVYTTCMPGAGWGQMTSDPLGSELQISMSYHVGAGEQTWVL